MKDKGSDHTQQNRASPHGRHIQDQTKPGISSCPEYTHHKGRIDRLAECKVRHNKKQKNSSIQYDEEYFEKREEYLKILSKINDEIQNNTKEKMKISEKLNTIFSELNHLEEIKKMLEKKNKNLMGVCKHCGSSSSITQLADRLTVMNNIDEISYQIDTTRKSMELEQQTMNEFIEREKKVKNIYNEYMSIIKREPDLKSIDSYIQNSAESLASDVLIKKKEKAGTKVGTNIVEIKKNESLLRTLESKQQKKTAEISKKYEELFLDIISSSLTSISNYTLKDYPFLNFTKIKGSGTDANLKTYLVYLIYFNLLNSYSEVKIPFLIDSFITTELDIENKKEMFSAVSKYFLELDSQTFFTVIEENLEYITNHEKYKKHFIHSKPILKDENYEENLEEFKL